MSEQAHEPDERIRRLLTLPLEDFVIDVEAAGAGEFVIVEANADQLVIVSYDYSVSAPGELRWREGTLDRSAAKSGRMSVAANGGKGRDGTRRSPVLTLDPGHDLILHVSAAMVVGGHGTLIRNRGWRV